MSKRALITGGNGYIGHQLQKELKLSGYSVIVIDKKDPSLLMSNNYCDLYIQADLTDKYKLFEIFPAIDIDIVFHLAGHIEVGESEQHPLEYYENNVVSTINTLSLMKRIGCDKIVFSSTAAVYGEDEISVYGKTKIMSEDIIKDAHKEKIHGVCLRYFNVAGADSNGEFGENHYPETHLIPNLFLKGGLTINGDDYDTYDGTCARDYVHVEDLAYAHVLAADYLFKGNSTNFFDIGSGNSVTVKQIVVEAERVLNKKIKTTIGPRRPGDPAVLQADNTRAECILMYKPEHTLDTIIKTAYNWEVKQKRVAKRKRTKKGS
jgi:UDP-glucose 4-epimerase